MSPGKRYQWVYLLMGGLALWVGMLLYIAGRGLTSPVYLLIPASEYLEKTSLAIWIGACLEDHPTLTFSLPDGLWMFGLMSVQLWIWRGVKNKTSTGSLAAVYILGVGYEALQSIGITPGTYDKIDLAFMIIGGQLPVIVDYIIQTKTK